MKGQGGELLGTAREKGAQVLEGAQPYVDEAKKGIKQRLQALYNIPGYTPEVGKNAKKSAIGYGVMVATMVIPEFIIPFWNGWYAIGGAVYGTMKARKAIKSIDTSAGEKRKSRDYHR